MLKKLAKISLILSLGALISCAKNKAKIKYAALISQVFILLNLDSKFNAFSILKLIEKNMKRKVK